MKTYRTGTIYSNPSTWVEDKRTASFVTMRRLRWSEDLVNEKGVMHPTAETVRVKIKVDGASGEFLYKKGFGYFRDNPDEITIKAAKLDAR